MLPLLKGSSGSNVNEVKSPWFKGDTVSCLSPPSLASWPGTQVKTSHRSPMSTTGLKDNFHRPHGLSLSLVSNSPPKGYADSESNQTAMAQSAGGQMEQGYTEITASSANRAIYED